MVCAICRGGCPEGSLGYALSLARRATGRRRVGAEVVEQLRHAAEAELPTAIYLLGVLTDSGLGMPRDPAAAAQLYRGAAEKGHRSAQVRWGLTADRGTRCRARSRRRRSRGFVARRSPAIRKRLPLVGNLYVQSGPLPPNYAEAANWYRRAAEAGHGGAARGRWVRSI